MLDLPSPLNVEPLPNLDFRVVAGDSLIDRLGGIVLPDSLPLDEYNSSRSTAAAGWISSAA